ncbi:MAG: hypothetical protein ABIO79_06710 [Ferruginibacter sp.]
MKILKMLPAIVLGLSFLQATAQTEAPKGFSKGNIVLPDNTIVSGYIKDNIRKDASVILLADGKEKKYNGSDIVSAEIDGTGYNCIKGDFFKIVCKGELTFLQKASNASSKPTYIGNEVFFVSGTEGKPGDYFIYENKSRELKLVSKKNLNDVVASSFGGYTPAIEKAKAAQADIAQLKGAVESYNTRNGE